LPYHLYFGRTGYQSCRDPKYVGKNVAEHAAALDNKKILALSDCSNLVMMHERKVIS